MIILREGQERLRRPANLRFLLMLWFCVGIFAYSFLPVSSEAAAAAASVTLPEEYGEYLLLVQLPKNEPVYEVKANARNELAERLAAEAEAEAKARAEAEAAAKAEAAAAAYGRELVVPTSRQANSGFKSFMDYRVLQNRRSGQYILQQDAATDEQGFRIYDGCYMVALGTYYAKGVGERFRITLDSGESFLAITGDIKSDAHTDALHQHRNGNIVEFIVDSSRIPAQCRRMGDMSYAGFSGRIKSIEKLN